MNPLTRALIVYSVQVAALIAVCAAAAAAIDLAYPRARLAYWRAVIVLSLLLPLWPARVVDVAVQATAPSRAAFAVPVARVSDVAPLEQPLRYQRALLVNWLPVLVAAGAFARFLWLAAGLLALRRFAADGDPVSDADLVELQRQIAPEASVRWHGDMGQPVTFGIRHPIVLLPRSLRNKETEIQRAALCHELFHAARGDWAVGLVEESVASAFWFHPAMRWAINQAQLCREQQIDELSIVASGSRRGYLQALLEFAGKPAVRTAAAFGRSRQLASRIKHLSREVVMSRGRFGISTALLVAVMAGSTWAVASAVPLRVDVRYHAASAPTSAKRESALVLRPVNRDATLEKSAPPVTALQQLQGAAPALPPPPTPISSDLFKIKVSIDQLVAQLGTPAPTSSPAPIVASLIRPIPAYPGTALKYGVGATVTLKGTVTQTGNVTDVSASRWSLTIDRDIQDPGYWVTSPQQPFIDAATVALQKWSFEPRKNEATIIVTFNFSPDGPRRIANVVEMRDADGTVYPGASVTFRSGTDRPAAVRVGGNVRAPRNILHVDPIYPQAARDSGVQGVVILEITLDADGTVADARILRSVPLLDQAAIDAVRQWRYEPVLVNGIPTPVIMTITVNFALRD